ncbi:MAG: hypothetical protein KKG47_04350 [Proteobacteria bacterium]|nr:hypothetical protein [Pseudomonadota bacterium]MBU1738173.1 hypothetical protein [Pseudomonadota bacterium]
MTYRSYLESGGGHCPKCGSKAIKYSSPPEWVKGDQMRVAMFCATCGARWRDIYNLSRAEDL